MIISQSAKFILFHVPKTGGSTIRLSLRPHLPSEDLFVSGDRKANADALARLFGCTAPLTKHSTPAEAQEVLGDTLFADFRQMLFVRNPYSRAFSAFRYIAQRARQGVVQHGGVKYDLTSMTFEAFLASPLAGAGGKYAARPQVDWVPDPDAVAFLGRTETLNEDIARFGKSIGGPFEKLEQMETRNASGSRDAWKEMSGEARAIIREKFAQDFETFGYSTEID